MTGSRKLAQSLPLEISAHVRDISHPPQVVLAPSYPVLALVSEMLSLSPFIGLCAQDCSPHPEGAYTGDVSAGMLRDMGCGYVILGHSERRTYHSEGDSVVFAKLLAAQNAGLTPVVCVGESLAEREAGTHFAVVEKQLKASILLGGVPEKPFLVAYEPVWAIGTGKVPTSEDIVAMHKHIASVLSCATSGGEFQTPILYGGSVKPSNAHAILSLDGVDGVLVGGASLKSDEFNAIISAAAETRK